MVNGPEMIVFEKNGLVKEVQFVVNGPVMTVFAMNGTEMHVS